MLIDLTQVYVNSDDTPALTGDTRQPITLRFMLVQALLAESPNVSTEEKIKRYSLFRDIKKAGDTIELPVEDIAVLKRAATIFSTLVMGQTHEMLERAAAPDTASLGLS
jgi:hypothetical protein